MPLVRVSDAGAETLANEEYKSEGELEDVLQEHPQLLNETGERPWALVSRQLNIPDCGIADLVFVDESGVPVVAATTSGSAADSG